EIGAFTPVFRSHAANDAPRAEPWVDGPDHLAIRRRYIEERYRLLPYLYGLARDNALTGDPIMRPTFYDYPAMAKAPCDQSMAFILGSDLLIAASPKPESPQSYDVCLPGKGWYDYWSGEPLAAEKTRETPRLDRLPLFVRPGAIIAKQPLVQSTADKPRGPLELHVYPGDDCRGTLYLDDGVSIAGPNLSQALSCSPTADGVAVRFGPRQGSFVPWWRAIAITVHGPRPLRRTIADQPRAAVVDIR
ncbi:MAG: TIM-barrel domain-containing protein, partial [Sphingomicrobium sp.]